VKSNFNHIIVPIYDRTGDKMKKQLSIEGMSCKHCVNHVTEALKDVTGVSNVSVSLSDKKAVIDVKEDISDAVLKKAVEEVGYDVVDIQNL
jgi:copper chaperone CopZ